MNALAGLMNPANPANQLTQAFEAGVQKREEKEARNALAAYALDPADISSHADMAKYNPAILIQDRERMAKQREAQYAQELRARALAGDRAAQTELATLDTDAYNRMTDAQKAQVDAGDDALANAAFQIIQAPPEQRSAMWDQYAQQLGRPEYVGQYSDQMLNTVVSRAGIQERFQKFQQPDYVAVGEGGLAGFQFGQPMNGGGNMAPSQNSGIPEGAIAELRGNPDSAAQFDEIFGVGAAAKILGGAGSNASGGFPEG